MSAPGFVLWFTGLPAAGKSTLARRLQQQLAAAGIGSQLLDSDELRRRLTPQPTYSAAERDWFYDMVVFLAELLAQNGVNVLIAATAPRRRYRTAARRVLPRFAEIFVDCPVDLCRERDPKQLWQRAAAGDIDNLPGAGAPYEPPEAPELRLNSADLSPDAAVDRLLHTLRELAFIPPLRLSDFA